MLNFKHYFLQFDPYKDRVISNTQEEDFIVDTVRVPDQPEGEYETGISSPHYNNGKWVIVEVYKSEEEARKGHDRWVKVMQTKPNFLTDTSHTFLTEMLDSKKGETWRRFPRKER